MDFRHFYILVGYKNLSAAFSLSCPEQCTNRKLEFIQGKKRTKASAKENAPKEMHKNLTALQ
jgi:hypothetical protein